jgi:hypothetical protein
MPMSLRRRRQGPFQIVAGNVLCQQTEAFGDISTHTSRVETNVERIGSLPETTGWRPLRGMQGRQGLRASRRSQKHLRGAGACVNSRAAR